MSTTSWIIISVMFILIAWDVYLYSKDKKTISQYIREYARISMGVTFLFGYLMGHWFWPLGG